MIILNRIGIVLNFFAGFLIAPELIGIDRLRKFETFLENRFDKIKSKLSNKSSNLSSTHDSLIYGLIVFIFLGVFAPRFTRDANIKRTDSFIRRLWLTLIEIPYLTIMLIVIVVLLLIWFIQNLTLLTFVRLMQRIIQYFIRRLLGEERFRSLIIGLGILFYVLGNLLQFIATYP